MITLRLDITAALVYNDGRISHTVDCTYNAGSRSLEAKFPGVKQKRFRRRRNKRQVVGIRYYLDGFRLKVVVVPPLTLDGGDIHVVQPWRIATDDS